MALEHSWTIFQKKWHRRGGPRDPTKSERTLQHTGHERKHTDMSMTILSAAGLAQVLPRIHIVGRTKEFDSHTQCFWHIQVDSHRAICNIAWPEWFATFCFKFSAKYDWSWSCDANHMKLVQYGCIWLKHSWNFNRQQFIMSKWLLWRCYAANHAHSSTPEL